MLAAGLAGVSLISSVIAAGFCVWYVWSARQNLAAQTEIMHLNAKSQVVRALMLESVDYSKRNSAIVPILQMFIPRQNTNSPAVAPVLNP